MQLKNQLTAKISALWKMKSALLLTHLLSMTACTSVQEKSNREIWQINNVDLVLYRVLDDETELAIPLSHKTVTQFMCVSKKEFDRVVEDMVKQK
jgi:hypothetical protein